MAQALVSLFKTALRKGEAGKNPAGGKVALALFVAILVVAVSVCAMNPAKSLAADTQSQTVRVGWYKSDLFQEGMSDDQAKSGYCYDYLQKVSDYTSWRYEYVYGEWPELMAKLQSGEIDVLAGVSPTEERKKTMSFPDSAMGTDQYYIYKHASDTSINSSDLSSLNGKKAGGVKDNRAALFTQQWIESNGLDVEMVYYDSFSEQEAAFDRGDISLMTQTINNVLSLPGVTIVSKVGEEPFYLAVTKGRADLLGQLNTALTTILSVDPFLLESLQYSNYGATLTSRTLTQEELDWVKAHPVITVGYLENYLPYSGTDGQGKATGLMTDVMDAIIDSLGLSDSLSVRYKGYAAYDDMIAALNAGDVDAVFPVSGNLWTLEKSGIDASSAVVDSSMAFVHKGSFDKSQVRTVAVNYANSLQVSYCQKVFPGVTLVPCSSIEECLQAVLDERADGTIVNALRTGIVTGTVKYRTLSCAVLDGSDARCFGVRGDETELLLLLNRGLKIIGSSYGLNHANKYVDSLSTYNVSDFLMDNFWWMLLVCLAVLATIIGLALRNSTNKRKSAEAIAAHAGEVMALNAELEERQAQLEDVSAEQESQIEEITALNAELEESQSELSRNLAVIQSTSERFFCMYWMDIANDVFYEIKALPSMQAVVGKTGAAQESMRLMYERTVISEDRQAMLDFSDMSTWVDRFVEADMAFCEYRGVTSGWSRAWLFCARRDSSGKCTHVVFANETIHDEIATRELLVEQKAQLDHARKQAEAANEAKTSFLFNMSHDIRTPMNAVIGFTDLLRKHQDDPERRKDYLDKIEGSSRVLLSIVNNVLEMARIERGEISLNETPMNIREFMDGIVAVFADMMKAKGLAFDVTVDVDHEYVYADNTKSTQIMNNIISNAYKYTEPGGQVHVDVREMPNDREGFLTLRATIADTGIGMDADFLPTIFDEFTREHTSTEIKVEGTGLGMPIVKKLVDHIGGTLEVQSEKGVGTTFIAELPCRIADARELGSDGGSEQGDYSGMVGKRILLVEDNDLNAEIAAELLAEFDLLVERAENGLVAVERLAASPSGYFDAVLMDIQMPVMGGYEAAHAIRAFEEPAKASIPIVAMTANAFEEDRKEALRMGMDDHVAKPVNVIELMRALAGVLG